MMKDRIPVTILTGFLGAGKTTLLNQLVKGYPQKRFAIIENEFGAVGIDRELVMQVEGGSVYELSNGCICCTVNQEFGLTINRLLMTNAHFNHLIIETTGIADPSTIVELFVSGERMQKKFVLDSVICLADALHIEDLLEEEVEVRQQVTLSDTILINKTDMVARHYPDELSAILKSHNPTARILKSQYGVPAEESLIDVYAFEASKIAKETRLYFEGLVPLSTASEKKLENKHQIEAFAFSLEGLFDREKFESWMGLFLMVNSQHIFRAKGIISFDGEEESLVFQAVRQHFNLEKGQNALDNKGENKIVFIGKGLKEEELEAGLKSLMLLKE